MEWLFEFPEVLKPNFTAIDNAVRAFAVWADPVLSAISGGLQGMVSGISFLLGHIPWPLLVALVVFMGWKSCRRLRTGVLYGILFAVIGAVVVGEKISHGVHGSRPRLCNHRSRQHGSVQKGIPVLQRKLRALFFQFRKKRK